MWPAAAASGTQEESESQNYSSVCRQWVRRWAVTSHQADAEGSKEAYYCKRIILFGQYGTKKPNLLNDISEKCEHQIVKMTGYEKEKGEKRFRE